MTRVKVCSRAMKKLCGGVERLVDNVPPGLVLVGQFYVPSWILRGIPRGHLIAGCRPAALALAQPAKCVTADAEVRAHAVVGAVVKKAHAVVLSDESGSVLRLHVLGYRVVVLRLGIVLEAPPALRDGLGQRHHVGITPLREAEAVPHFAVLGPRVVLEA